MRAAGAPIRDFIFIDDVSCALVLAGVAERVPPVLNLGTGEGHSLAAVVQVMEDLLGRPLATTDGPLRKADIPTSVLDVSLMRGSVGFAPTISLHQGVELTLRHWQVV